MLVHEHGERLDDEEYLEICRTRGWAEQAVKRLLSLGRTDDAFRTAMQKLESEKERSPGHPPHSLRRLAAIFVEEADEPGLAEEMLRPYAEYDALHAELFARCLAAQGKDEAKGAWLLWFAKRPTLATFVAIEDALSGRGWDETREQLLANALSRGLLTTIADVAVHEDDPVLLEDILPRMNAQQLSHARARVDPLRDRLSPEAARRLEAPPTVEAADTACPSDEAQRPAYVSHPKFGKGRVLRVEGTGAGQKYVVDFGPEGEKTILGRFLTAES